MNVPVDASLRNCNSSELLPGNSPTGCGRSCAGKSMAAGMRTVETRRNENRTERRIEAITYRRWAAVKPDQEIRS
jgi:hypothetical protein